MNDLERAEQTLRNEFIDQPHTKHDLLGNAACARKIRNLIVAYIKDNIEKSKCSVEIKSLMLDSGVAEEYYLKEIEPYIDSFYRAKELIDYGYCDVLKK